MIEYLISKPNWLQYFQLLRYLRTKKINNNNNNNNNNNDNENNDDEELDEDVFNEQIRVKSGFASQDDIRIESLQKSFFNKSNVKVAIKNLWLGIPHGECFGNN